MISREKILELVKPILDEKKFFIVTLTISSSNRITVHVDGLNGVKMEDCIHLSRAIEHGLDREEEDFELEVSSAGLGAPFTMREQYLKNIGKDIDIQHSDGCRTKGKLIEVNKNDFVVEYRKRKKIEGKKKKQTVIESERYNYNEINKVNLVISFK